MSEPPWDGWTEQDDKPYVVYGLVHPMTLQCFYVGITTDLYKRFIQHISCTQDNPEKNEVILDLKRQNFIPDCVLLASSLHEHEAKRSEAFVTDLSRQMKQPLANQTLWCGYDPTEIEKT